MTKLADEITPKKEYSIRSERPAWLTNDLLNIQKDRDFFYKKAKRAKIPEDWMVARRHRNIVNIKIRNAKSAYIKHELLRNKSNPKKFWREIHKNILPKNKSQTLNLLDPITQLPLPPNEIPENVNNFLAGIGPKLADNFPNIDVDNFTNDAVYAMPMFEVTRTDIATVLKHIKNMSVYKSSGLSDLGSRLLKDVFLYIPDILVEIFNKIIDTGRFPDCWKIATVIPLPKIDNPKSP